jgi:hypothetical protein
MKKLSLVLAIVLGMGAMAFAQDISAETYEEAGLFGKGNIIFRSTDEVPMIDFDHGEEDDQNADAPLGSGIAVLLGLGGAYLTLKKKEEKA